MSKAITKAVTDKLVSTVTNKVSNKINQLINSKTNAQSNKKKKKSKTKNVRDSDYAPTARSSSFSNSAPTYSRTATTCRIRHTEMVANIVGSIAWNMDQTLQINPGLAGSFPWLSTQARGWEKYRFHTLSYEYRTRTGTGTTGSVSIFPDFDPSDTFPLDDISASSYTNYKEDSPWKNIATSLTKSMLTRDRFCRLEAVPDHMSLADYDVGRLFIGTTGGETNGTPWGKLYVTYDIEFLVPQFENLAHTNTSSNALTRFVNAGLLTGPFGTGTTSSPYSDIVMVAAGTQIAFENLIIGERYFVSVSIFGTSLSTPASIVYTGVASGLTGATGAIGTTAIALSRWFTAIDNTATLTVVVPAAPVFNVTCLTICAAHQPFSVSSKESGTDKGTETSSSSSSSQNPSLSRRGRVVSSLRNSSVRWHTGMIQSRPEPSPDPSDHEFKF